MIDLPMMGQAGIPPATTYYPPAPQRAGSLHNHADMQRLFGKQDRPASLVPFEMAQNCLRKAVKSLEIAMRNTARDAIGPLSPQEAGTGESFH